MKTDRVPPQNIEAEMSILGAVFVDNSAIDQVHGILVREDFYRESHRVIFGAMSELADQNEPVDIVSMTAVLKSAGTLEQVGGAAYLAFLIDYVFTSANVTYYCRLVADAAAARRVLQHAQAAMTKIYDGAPLEEVVSELEVATVPVASRRINEPVVARDVLRESFREMERRFESRGQVQGIPYGLPDLDSVTDGMHRGELIVIAGRPSMGKTTLALNVLENVSALGLHGLLFSLEMSRQNNMDKIMASHGKVKYQRIRSGKFEDGDWGRMTRASEAINRWSLHIDDTPGISLREVRTKARRLKKSGLDVLVIDYLQLMTLSARDNRVQALGEVSRGLKQLARDLDIAVVALSQLNRGVDSRDDKRPRMSDLRDSGEIEQDSDVILFPFRPAAYCQKCKDKQDFGDHNTREHQAKAEIIVEKQRNGERNISVPVVWLGEYQRFESLDVNHV